MLSRRCWELGINVQKAHAGLLPGNRAQSNKWVPGSQFSIILRESIVIDGDFRFYHESKLNISIAKYFKIVAVKKPT